MQRCIERFENLGTTIPNGLPRASAQLAIVQAQSLLLFIRRLIIIQVQAGVARIERVLASNCARHSTPKGERKFDKDF